MSDKPPAFMLYTKDLLSDGNVLAMELDEFGLYCKLMAIYWNENGLPDDADRLAKMVKISREVFDRLWVNVAPCFTSKKGRLHQKRLDKERQKQAKHRKQQQLNALSGWQKRQCDGNAAASNPRSDGNALHLHLRSAVASASAKKKPSARLAFGGKVLEVPKFLDEEFVKRLNGQYFDLTQLYLDLDAQLEKTGEAWDLRWIRDQFAKAAPQPERELHVTAEERRKAEEVRRKTGGCMHDPQHETAAECITAIVRHWRGSAA